MTSEGFASKHGTKTFSEKFKSFKFNPLGKTDLYVSEVGFGGYRIDIRSPLNREALKKALLSGINLIDTSSTYTDGNSELLIGAVLKELIDANLLSRESVVIVTKCGYLQGENYQFSQERKAANYPFRDLVDCGPGMEHCIHPDFIQDQIKKSMDRMEIDTIDVFMLHNPEYYLKWAEKNKIDKETARTKYYERIKKAFEYLEKEVQKGRIKHYGISSNTFPEDADHYEFTSLERIINIAEEISKNNHFSVIEFPMNILETAAGTRINQPENMTLLELAEKNNLGVLINRPLNAFYNNKVIRLAEPFLYGAPSTEEINLEIENINALEKTISEKLKSCGFSDIAREIENNLFISGKLQNKWKDAKSISNWESALNQYFLPRFHYYKNFIKNNSLKNEELEIDLFSCTFKVGKLFSIIGNYYKNEHLKLTDKIKKDLAEAMPIQAKKLSNSAIRILRATKGVTAVLVGMINPPYVADVIDELKVPVKKDFDLSKIKIAVPD